MITRLIIRFFIILGRILVPSCLLLAMVYCENYDLERSNPRDTESGTYRLRTPTVSTTNPPTNITSSSALVSGKVTDDGYGKIVSSGVCYGFTTNPTVSTYKVSASGNLSSFSVTISGLFADTVYHARAYAYNNLSQAPGYGADVVFTTLPGVPTVSTTAISEISSTTSISGGSITSDGGSSVTARGVCWNTATGPTIANNKTTDGTGTGNFASNISGLSPNVKYYARAYATNSYGTSYGNEVSFTALAACISITSYHVAGTTAPVTKTVTYGTVETKITGSYKCWITRNLGADNQAASVTDATEPVAGWYWQFNSRQGYKYDGSVRTPSTTWNTSINASSDWTGANDPCTSLLGTGWRIPTYTEWTGADGNGAWNTQTDAYASVLKIHSAGYINATDGMLLSRGSGGYYWSSTQYNNVNGRGLSITSTSSNPNNVFDKANGFPLRCLRD